MLGEAAGEVVACVLADVADAVLTFAGMVVALVAAWAGGEPAFRVSRGIQQRDAQVRMNGDIGRCT